MKAVVFLILSEISSLFFLILKGFDIVDVTTCNFLAELGGDVFHEIQTLVQFPLIFITFSNTLLTKLLVENQRYSLSYVKNILEKLTKFSFHAVLVTHYSDFASWLAFMLISFNFRSVTTAKCYFLMLL